MLKKKNILLGNLAIVVLSFLIVGKGFAQPPPMPSSFYGTVKANGSNVPLSTKVAAWIDGVKYAETSVIEPNGDTVYNLDVPGDNSGTPEIEGGKPGELITFSINNDFTSQTGTWQSGTNTELNLSVSQVVGNSKLYIPIIYK